MNGIHPWAWVAAVLTATTPPALAAEIEGVSLPDQLAVGGQNLPLVSCGMREFVFANLYAAALYAPTAPKSRSELAGAATPKAVLIKVTYDGNVPNKVPDAWRTQFNEQAKQETVRALAGLYEDLKAGDTVTITFVPDKGTTITHNGRAVVAQSSDRPMTAILDVLMGADAPSQVRRDLLSGSC